MALRAEELIHSTRIRLSMFFDPSLAAAGLKKDPNRLVFAANATAALNLIVQETIFPGDHVVTTWTEHNLLIRQVNHLVQRGAEATFVRPDRVGYVDREAIRAALRPDTKLMIVNHASNLTGTVQDAAAVKDVCRAPGVPLALDTAQTAGVLPIDMAAWGVSFVAFTRHKGLLGPTGTGGVCVADDAEIASSLWGGTGVRSAEPLHLTEFPYRLEVGMLNLAGIAGLAAGQAFLAQRGSRRSGRTSWSFRHFSKRSWPTSLASGCTGNDGSTVGWRRGRLRWTATVFQMSARCWTSTRTSWCAPACSVHR